MSQFKDKMGNEIPDEWFDGEPTIVKDLAERLKLDPEMLQMLEEADASKSEAPPPPSKSDVK